MKIIDNVKAQLNEIGHGPKEVQFAFIDDKTGKTITPFCMCKDFFNDMFWCNKLKKNISIFGFKWTANQDKGVLNRGILSLTMRLRDRNNKEKFFEIAEGELKGIKSILNKFEQANGFNKSNVDYADDKNYLVVSFDKAWSNAPYLISAFLFLIRLGLTYDAKSDVIEWFKVTSKKFISPNDAVYFKNSEIKIKDLLNGKIDKKQSYEMYDEGTIHSSSGLVNCRDYKIEG